MAIGAQVAKVLFAIVPPVAVDVVRAEFLRSEGQVQVGAVDAGEVADVDAGYIDAASDMGKRPCCGGGTQFQGDFP